MHSMSKVVVKPFVKLNIHTNSNSEYLIHVHHTLSIFWDNACMKGNSSNWLPNACKVVNIHVANRFEEPFNLKLNELLMNDCRFWIEAEQESTNWHRRSKS